jgi:serine/threonine-protein kinase HipA
MNNRLAEIWFKDRHAGILTETATGGTRFSYNPTWTEEIACSLPIIQREHEWQNGLHPFFQHLGPEGWLREQQARVAHIVEEDDLGLLLQYGADCIGAVSVLPAEKEVPSIEITEATSNPGRTISGFQKKLLVTKNETTGQLSPALAKGPAPYIAKFNSPKISDLVRNEALSLRWVAAVLGKEEVNEFRLASIHELDEIALVVTRFDRGAKGEKLRLEDFSQISCKPKGLNYGGKYNAAYEDIAALILKHSARPAIDLAKFYKRLIAFVLIGNTDAHLKNFSLLETPSGLRLSPVYDVVNAVMYPRHDDQNLALSIGGNKIKIDIVNKALLHNFGKEIGLTQKTIEQTFVDLKRQVLKAAPIIRPPEAESADGFVTRFEEIVRNACYRILEG